MDWRPWMDAFLPPLLEALPGRVAFVGIQGSFGRGEAGPESDVDLVVVLDALGAADHRFRRHHHFRFAFATSHFQ